MKRHAPKAGSRAARVGALVLREAAQWVLMEIDDGQIRLASLAQADVSPDLKQARIYVTHYQGEGAARAAVAHLNLLAPLMRRELASRLRLRVAPNLVFSYDPSVDQGFRIDALLDQARRERRGEDDA
ncbi:30S ribosome-binding factor RbfA [Acidiferrobacter sp.]|uniref:30S ribosome-binding factor RbfA n=1 Tax=Acidiferrobacter sp. TaxID=1872107 RepID=UPI0026183CF0|nr:30S ribosome-binding factor RbfA [Acidiferrobacter sp.]